MVWKPHVTVAAVAQRHDRFLFVEERVGGKLVINQPAGHLESGENLIEAVVRETLEETAWHFEPEALVGIYLWRQPQNGSTFLRFSFAGRVSGHDTRLDLDDGIERALWLNRDQIISQQPRLRSPMVLRGVDDFLAGQRIPLAVLESLDLATDVTDPPRLRVS
ncbi:MAG: NUDIX hydrolase [Chromatiales bacterium]|jgi:8-oxo-dGTP pyrophosphatase MutT (NUDIX family)|nr:NUDIX hydrolase [Chromatiales bacterium]MDH3946796.1 NUDIX hydrolase [Chromatiales bacterium]MDH4014337.1 NUDIX hydrolase [Chromatiales bacterium]PLX55581.1 MAG: NUDIX hydrolase [Chromatiales bacterium]